MMLNYQAWISKLSKRPYVDQSINLYDVYDGFIRTDIPTYLFPFLLCSSGWMEYLQQERVCGPPTPRSLLSAPLQKACQPCFACARQCSNGYTHPYWFHHCHCPLKRLCLSPHFSSERDEGHRSDWCSISGEDCFYQDNLLLNSQHWKFHKSLQLFPNLLTIIFFSSSAVIEENASEKSFSLLLPLCILNMKLPRTNCLGLFAPNHSPETTYFRDPHSAHGYDLRTFWT